MCLSLSVSTKLSKQYLQVGAKDGIFASIVRPALKRLPISPSKKKSPQLLSQPQLFIRVLANGSQKLLKRVWYIFYINPSFHIQKKKKLM